MAQLVVRKLEDDIIRRLKARAGRDGVSAEEEHRRILRKALLADGAGSSFKQYLRLMPDVGSDADFERIPQPDREVEL